MNLLKNSSQIFETYRGHDQVLAFIGYNSSMISSLLPLRKSELATGLANVSSQIANARVILRLLDDSSMLYYTLSYGLGKQVLIQIHSNLMITINQNYE
jgi:hypothetical protein